MATVTDEVNVEIDSTPPGVDIIKTVDHEF
jgi:hypothetical protein